jgi:hypothetical protein
MIASKILRVTGGADGLLRTVGAAQAQGVKPAHGNTAAKGG